METVTKKKEMDLCDSPSMTREAIGNYNRMKSSRGLAYRPLSLGAAYSHTQTHIHTHNSFGQPPFTIITYSVFAIACFLHTATSACSNVRSITIRTINMQCALVPDGMGGDHAPMTKPKHEISDGE